MLVVVRAAEKYPDRIVSTDGKTVEWTADWPTDARVEFLGNKPLSFKLNCNLLRPGFFGKGKRNQPKRTEVR